MSGALNIMNERQAGDRPRRQVARHPTDWKCEHDDRRDETAVFTSAE